LIINAQQALLDIQGQRLLRVHARPAEQPAGGPLTVVIEVADSGLGIPQALRSRVFEPFYTTKPVGMGTGIGLSLCHGIATSHGGSIEVDDAAEGGALFRVRLPVRQPDAEKEARAETKAPAVRALADTQEVVLIVDDEPEVAEMLAEILSDMGYRTVIAHSGRQALQQLGLQRIALILSDLRMPDLDGFGLYQALAESHPNMIRRLVFITGDTLQNNAPGGALPPGVLVLEKPFLPADVKYVVTRLLGTDNKHVLPASVQTH
jgi:two-component system NtrC family sensor kinase